MIFKNKKRKSGVTIIEMMIVISISAMLIASFLQFVIRTLEDDRIDKFANDVTKVVQGVMRRLDRDNPDFSHWITTYNQEVSAPFAGAYPRGSMGTAPIKDVTDTYIHWSDNESMTKSLLRNFLVGSEYKTDRCGGWEAQDGGVPGGALENRETALIPCSLWQTGDNVMIPFEINMQAIAIGADNQLSDFIIYIDMRNELTDENQKNGSGIIGGVKLERYIQRHLKKEIIGSQSITWVSDIGDIDNQGDDIGFVGNQAISCGVAIRNGNDCFLKVHLDTTSTTNDRYLKVDGTNDMRAAISFSESDAVPSQKCIRWIQNGAIWELDTEGGVPEVDCGLWGGFDSPDSVDSVVDITSTENLFITPRDSSGVPVTNLCRLYEADNSNDQNIGHFANDTGLETPCGLTHDGSVVQLVTNEVHIDKMYAEDLMVQDIRSNRVKIKYDPTNYANNVLLEIINDDPISPNNNIFTINSNGVINVGSDVSPAEFNVNGNVNITNDLTVNRHSYFELDGNGELVQFNINTDTNITIANNPITSGVYDNEEGTKSHLNDTNLYGNNNFLGINITNGSTSNGFAINTDKDLYVNAEHNVMINSGKNISLNADDRLNIDSNVFITGENKFYSNRSSLRDRSVESLSGNTEKFSDLESNISKNRNFEFVTRDYISHFENISSNLSIKSVSLVGGAGSTVLQKPNCLEFIDTSLSSFESPYYGTTIYDDVNADPDLGYNYARIILIPVWFKTYSYGFGDNQAYTHHAVDSASDQWEVFNYLSGEGLSGTGAREDGAGSSLAMIYCDYSSVNFN